MTYEQLKDLQPGASSVPAVCLHRKSRQPPKLSLETQFFMTCQDWREYRTYFHFGLSWRESSNRSCPTRDSGRKPYASSKALHIPGKQQLRDEGRACSLLSLLSISGKSGRKATKNNRDSTAKEKALYPAIPTHHRV
jgi:hypothetical protein